MDSKIILIAAVAVVAVVGAGAFVMLSGNNDNETPTADPSDCRLWIVGNANLDDYLNDDDIAYMEEIIDGKHPMPVINLATNKLSENVNMADMNNDGKVDSTDVDLLKKLIKKDVTSIEYVDVDGVRSSVHYPISTAVVLYYNSVQQVNILGKSDIIIACDAGTSKGRPYSPELDSKATILGSDRFDPPVETIMKLNPDVILTGSRSVYCAELEKSLPTNRTNMELLRIPSWEDGNMIPGLVTLGFILNAEDKAKEYLDIIDPVLNLVIEKTSQLSDDDKVTVLMPKGRDNAKNEANGVGSGRYETTILAGAINYADKLNPAKDNDYPKFDDEWLGSQTELDYIIYCGFDKLTNSTYNKDWVAKMNTQYEATIKLTGVEIHAVSDMVILGPFAPVGAIYIAKIIYPDLFKDIDPDAVLQQLIDKFYPDWGFNVKEYGGISA